MLIVICNSLEQKVSIALYVQDEVLIIINSHVFSAGMWVFHVYNTTSQYYLVFVCISECK